MNRKQRRDAGMIGWTPFVEDTNFVDPLGNEDSRLFSNSQYHVVMREYVPSTEGPTLVHLSIRTNDRSTRHDWRDFQRIKNELLGTEEEAVELYPADSRLVDTSNQYHLWSFRGTPMPFGWNERLTMTTDEAEAKGIGAVQREGAGE